MGAGGGRVGRPRPAGCRCRAAAVWSPWRTRVGGKRASVDKRAPVHSDQGPNAVAYVSRTKVYKRAEFFSGTLAQNAPRPLSRASAQHAHHGHLATLRAQRGSCVRRKQRRASSAHPDGPPPPPPPPPPSPQKTGSIHQAGPGRGHPPPPRTRRPARLPSLPNAFHPPFRRRSTQWPLPPPPRHLRDSCVGRGRWLPRRLPTRRAGRRLLRRRRRRSYGRRPRRLGLWGLVLLWWQRPDRPRRRN